jgi:ubiquinone/menaquinone biosynthesis C-methylase UbiE
MERLAHAVELLDGPLDDPAALAGNLADLRRVNRWLGGISLGDAAIDALAAHRRDVSMLDVGTGGADIPLALVERARRRGMRLSVVGLDSRPEIVIAARAAIETSPAGSDGRVEIVEGDGLALPFPDRSFDIAHASLVAHHLEPAQVVALFGEMGRVARLGVIVNDLVRSRPAWIGAWLLAHTLTTNRYTRHDAPLSVRRAYRRIELAAMLVRAGLAPVRTMRGPFGHRVAIAAVPAGVRPTDADDG